MTAKPANIKVMFARISKIVMSLDSSYLPAFLASPGANYFTLGNAVRDSHVCFSFVWKLGSIFSVMRGGLSTNFGSSGVTVMIGSCFFCRPCLDLASFSQSLWRAFLKIAAVFAVRMDSTFAMGIGWEFSHRLFDEAYSTNDATRFWRWCISSFDAFALAKPNQTFATELEAPLAIRLKTTGKVFVLWELLDKLFGVATSACNVHGCDYNTSHMEMQWQEL